MSLDKRERVGMAAMLRMVADKLDPADKGEEVITELPTAVKSHEVKLCSPDFLETSSRVSYKEIEHITEEGDPKKGAILFNMYSTAQHRDISVWIPKSMLSNLNLTSKTFYVFNIFVRLGEIMDTSHLVMPDDKVPTTEEKILDQDFDDDIPF